MGLYLKYFICILVTLKNFKTHKQGSVLYLLRKLTARMTSISKKQNIFQSIFAEVTTVYQKQRGWRTFLKYKIWDQKSTCNLKKAML